jgi:hypothetical protein
MAIAALVCLALIVATTLLHCEALSLLARALDGRRWPTRARLVVAVLGCFAGHALEILLYGAAYWLLARAGLHGAIGHDAVPRLAPALYFSAETYTSLGFGDVVPSGPLRLLAGAEALNGLLLIAWSASFLYLEMERGWRPPAR